MSSLKDLTLQQLVKMYTEERGRNEQWDQHALALISNRLASVDASQIDTDSGAAIGVRAVVGNAKSPQDRLATFQSYFPEAIPYGDDNFLFANRRTGQPTLYNEPGLELGDLAEYGRETATTAAGIGAAVLAAPAATTGIGAAAPYVAGGASSAAAGAAYDQYMENIAGTVDTRTFGERLQDYTVEAGLGMLPIDKAFAPAMNFVRKAFIDPSKEVVRNVVAKYDIRPTAGTIGGGFLQSAEAASQRIGAAMDNFQLAADEMYEGIEGMIAKLFDTVGGPISKIESGRMVVDRGQGFIETFNKESDILYAELDKFVPPNTEVVADNLRLAAEGMLGMDALGETIEPALARKISNVISPDPNQPYTTTTYATLARMRSQIGEAIGNSESVAPGNIRLGEQRALYRAITEDLKAIAEMQGGEALDVWNRANDFYRAGRQTIDKVIVPLMTQRGGGEYLAPQAVQERLARLVSRDPDALRQLQTQGVLSGEDMGQVGAGILENVAQGTPGSRAVIEDRLSPARIPQQTSDAVLNPESRDILFNSTTNEILDDLRTLGAAIKGTDELVNRSGTANTTAFGGALAASGGVLTTAMQGEPITAIGVASAGFLSGVVLPYVASKGLQSKPFLNWLTKGIESGTGPEWRRAGARMAAKEGLMNLYDAIIEAETGNTGDQQDRGLLLEG